MENGPSISTVYVVLLGVMSVAVLLTVYHCAGVTWCNPQRRSQRRGDRAGRVDAAELSSVRLVPPAVGYDKAGGTASACAVCLSDFEDGEAVRLLPECLHCFHAECIDMWLRSHASCPMCRTEMSPIAASVAAQELEGRIAAAVSLHTAVTR